MIGMNAAMPVRSFFVYSAKAGVQFAKPAEGISSDLPGRDSGAGWSPKHRNLPSEVVQPPPKRIPFKFRPLESGCRYDVRV